MPTWKVRKFVIKNEKKKVPLFCFYNLEFRIAVYSRTNIYIISLLLYGMNIIIFVV